MKHLKVTPSHLQGSIVIPPSKSHTLRALVFAAMAKGKSIIYNYLKSKDTDSMIAALRSLGISIQVSQNSIEVVGSTLKPSENVIDAGNSGIVLRFLGALCASLPSYTVITGDHSIRHNRPIQPLLSALNQLNAFAVSSRLDGKAPIIVRGPLQCGHATLSGEDSQPVSALLIAASFLNGITSLEVTNPGERPWVDVTLMWLKRFGGEVSHQDYRNYTIKGPISYSGFTISIPGDFSSAAFPLVAACTSQSSITLENIELNDVQGDKEIISLLRLMGISLKSENTHLTIHGQTSIKAKKIDANAMIDTVPILAVLGCYAEGETEVVNASIARHKESDRIHSIICELRKMGADILEKEDGFIVYPKKLLGSRVKSHGDHRIAMALAVAALGAEGESIIEDVDCIAKSYPSFVSDFQKIGAGLCLI